jgi:hypothetical protein
MSDADDVCLSQQRGLRTLPRRDATWGRKASPQSAERVFEFSTPPTPDLTGVFWISLYVCSSTLRHRGHLFSRHVARCKSEQKRRPSVSAFCIAVPQSNPGPKVKGSTCQSRPLRLPQSRDTLEISSVLSANTLTCFEIFFTLVTQASKQTCAPSSSETCDAKRPSRPLRSHRTKTANQCRDLYCREAHLLVKSSLCYSESCRLKCDS